MMPAFRLITFVLLAVSSVVIPASSTATENRKFTGPVNRYHPQRRPSSIPTGRNPFLKSPPRRETVGRNIRAKNKTHARPTLRAKLKKHTARPVARRAIKPRVLPPTRTPPPFVAQKISTAPAQKVVSNSTVPAPVYTPPPPYAASPQMTKSKPIPILDPKKRGTVYLDMTKAYR